MKIKFRKEAKIIVKEVPEAFGGPYVPEQRRRDLSRFVMSDESLEAIERLRRQRKEEANRLKEYFGFGKEKQWWEDY
jgi:hypothetical protein